jgi:hypothetical protein
MVGMCREANWRAIDELKVELSHRHAPERPCLVAGLLPGVREENRERVVVGSAKVEFLVWITLACIERALSQSPVDD